MTHLFALLVALMLAAPASAQIVGGTPSTGSSAAAGTSGSASSGANGDSQGYGRQWFTGQTIFTDIPAAQAMYLVPYFLDDLTAVAIRGEAGGFFTSWTSTDGGSTWTSSPLYTVGVPANFIRHIGLSRFANGNYVTSTIQVNAATSSVYLGSVISAFTVQGGALPINTAARSQSRAYLNSMAIGFAGSPAQICVTQNSASTWTCATPAANTGFQNNAIDSPDNGTTWVAIDLGGNVFRTTNGGSSWTNVQTLAALGAPTFGRALSCLSTTVCLATNGANFYRSTDAGVTWTLVGNGLAADANMKAIVVFDSSNAALIGNVASGAALWYRTGDGGLTWVPEAMKPVATAGADTMEFVTWTARNTGAAITAPLMTGGQQSYPCPYTITTGAASCMIYTKPLQSGDGLVTKNSFTECSNTFSATGLGNAAVTLTVPGITSKFFYVCTIEIYQAQNAVNVATAGPNPILTTTNLQNQLVWWGDNSINMIVGAQKTLASLSFARGSLRTLTSGTAFTIVNNAGGQATQNLRINVTGFYGN